MKWYKIKNEAQPHTSIVHSVPKGELPDEIIIDGKLYNLKTSTLIYETENDDSISDLGFIVGWKRFFKTQKGNYFMYKDFGRSGRAISEEEIKNLILSRDLKKYRELFGEPEEA